MTKKLILIAVAACGLLCSGVAEAKVCRLGDAGCDNIQRTYGPGEGKCDESVYIECDQPRAGATYCMSSEKGALYKAEDCCHNESGVNSLSASGYQTCSADDNMVGYGKSCTSANNHKTYWQYCGCAYGFVDMNPTGSSIGSVIGRIEDESNYDIPYTNRCGTYSNDDSVKCQLAICRNDRRCSCYGRKCKSTRNF